MDAYKCDITSELVEGVGIKKVFVNITKNLRLVIIPERKTAHDKFAQGVISEAGVALIEKTVASLKDSDIKEAEKLAAIADKDASAEPGDKKK